MTTQKISTWKQLKTTLNSTPNGERILSRIRESGLNQDPDWLYDILTEVNDPNLNPHYFIPGFHDVLQNYTLDIQGIYDTFIKYYVEPNTHSTEELIKKLGFNK